MERKAELIINQTLHGYADGHMLLASSCDLSSIEKRALIIMSDLSGGNPDQNFHSYLTGYPLPGNRYYALGRTWYAPEMRRPGCVWTQTLLISLPLLGRIKQLKILDSLFSRPTFGSTSNYNNEILIDDISFDTFSNVSNDDELISTPIIYISNYLYSLPERTIVIPAESSALHEKSILSIWSLQWPRLRRQFSFCTGSLSLRKLDGKLLDCQIVPKGSSSIVLRRDSSVSSVVDFDLKLSNDSWLIILRKAKQKELSMFMHRYGSDLTGGRENFIPLCLAFHMADNSNINLNSLQSYILFFNKYFPRSEEAKRLKKDILLKKIKQTDKFSYSIILTLIEDPFLFSFKDIDWQLPEKIVSLWKDGEVSELQIKDLLQKFENSPLTFEDKFLLMNNLPLNTWLSYSWVSLALIKKILTVRPYLIESYNIWQSESYDIQQLWFITAEHVDMINWGRVLKVMLEVNNFEWLEQVVKHSKPQDLVSVFGKLLDEGYPFIEIKYFLINSIDYYISWLENQADYSFRTFEFICELLVSNKVDVKKLPKNTITFTSAFISFATELPARINLMALLLDLSFRNELPFSNKIVEILFQPFYREGVNNCIDQKSWQIIMSNRIQEIDRPYNFFSWFFEQYKPSVAAWDKCGKLRQILVESFVLYKWEDSGIVKVISERIVFQQIVDYCLTFSSGVAFLIRIQKSLELKRSEQKTFHFEIVTNALMSRRRRKKMK